MNDDGIEDCDGAEDCDSAEDGNGAEETGKDRTNHKHDDALAASNVDKNMSDDALVRHCEDTRICESWLEGNEGGAGRGRKLIGRNRVNSIFSPLPCAN